MNEWCEDYEEGLEAFLIWMKDAGYTPIRKNPI